MKRVFKCMCMMAVVALAFTSCKKTDEKTVFSGSTEGLVSETVDGRAYLPVNSSQPQFEIGDECLLFNINVDDPWDSDCGIYEATQAGPVVHFVPSPIHQVNIDERRKEAFYGFYPGGYGNTLPLLYEGQNRCKFRIHEAQTYREDEEGNPMISLGHMYMAAKVTDQEYLHNSYFSFRNICGVLDLPVYDPNGSVLQSIKFHDKAVALTGWVELIVPEVDRDEMAWLAENFDMTSTEYVNRLNAYKNRSGFSVTDSGRDVTLEIPGGIQLPTTAAAAKHFYIVLRPLAYTQGAEFTFTFNDGTYTLSTSSDNRIKPNIVKHIIPINVAH